MTWKLIKVPRSLYLPVVDPGGYKDSGRRVEPYDKIEILLGSTEIRINGVSYQLMIPTDSLASRLDKDDVLQLDPPAPPVALSAGGVGKAFVGRTGQARVAASGNFGPLEDQPRSSSSKKKKKKGKDLWGDLMGSDDLPIDLPVADIAPEVFSDPPWVGIRDYPSRDGTPAQIRYDKRTGKDIGTPFRPYQVVRDAEGRQLSSPTMSHGPQATFDMDAYRKKLREQEQHATIAPTGRERYEMAQVKNGERSAMAAALLPTPIPAHSAAAPLVSLGSPHLDEFLGSVRGTGPGVPYGSIVYLSGDAALRGKLLSSSITVESIEGALAKLFMLKSGANPIVTVSLPDVLTMETKVQLAEDISDIADALKAQPKAVLVLSTRDSDNKLLKFASTVSVNVEPLERDPRYMQVFIEGRSGTFPAP